MIIQAKAVKTGTALVPPIIMSTVPIDPMWTIFIMLGLVMGWMARIGKMVSHDASWPKIKKDLIVSILIGGGNGLLATIIIFYLGLNYLQGIGVAFLCAFAGVKTLETGVRWLFKKVMEDIAPDKSHQLDDDEE